ncbi:MAG: CBS domain-containing protein [Candidatus Marsarchaeota archaeon]|nr:CBS domain-containing protein [Candidatus Marsarchaeota archaeon]
MAKETDSIPEGLISQTTSFDSKTPITRIIPVVQKYGAVIIEKNNGYYGIVDSRAVYRYLQSFKVFKNEAAEKLVVRVPRITDSTTVDDVIYYFYKARAKALPYVKDNKIKGILTRPTLIKMLLSLNRLNGITVAEAMTAPLLGIDINSTVPQARTAMRENKLNRLVALDGEKFAGLITNYDLIDKYVKLPERLPEKKSYSYTPANIKLESVVETNPKMIEQSRGLNEAARLMVENDISSILVTKNDKPIGILTELDIIVSAMTSLGTETNKIFISGLDASTYEFEDEMRETLRTFLSKLEKLSGIKVDYVSVVVKKFKTNSYELHGRLSLGKSGTITSHITGHLFERTFSDLLDVLGKEAKKKKERYLSIRKVLHNAHEVSE